MAKFIIKESEIRNYVRRLIRESLDLEGKTKPEELQRWLSMSPEELQGWQSTSSRDNQHDIENRKKMLMGQSYNRGQFGDKSKDIERAYRQKMGFPPIVSVKGKTVLDVDGKGNDITAANTADAIAARKERARLDHNDKMARRFVRKQDRVDQNQSIDKFANNAENDPNTQRWLAMSPEERAAEAERIRQERIKQGVDSNLYTMRQISDYGRQGIKYPTKEELEQRIETLKAKRDALEDNDLNSYDRKMYNYIIKDTQRILNKYYNGVNNDNLNNVEDDIVGDAMKDIDNDSKFKDLEAEQGDNYINPSDFKPNDEPKPEEKQPEDPQFDPFDEVGEKGKRFNYKDALQMGMYGDDDDDFIF